MSYWDELMGDDEGAAQYMEAYGEGPGCETREVVASFINDRESVLDVGCGPGWNLNHFTMYGPDVKCYKGIDESERFIRVANDRRRMMHLPNGRALPFQLQDCHKLEEPDKSWDVVILQDVLEHTYGYEQPILETLRVARKRVIVSFWKSSFQDGADHKDEINYDGDVCSGATYNRQRFEEYLDLLCEGVDLQWLSTETSPQANRWHKFYIIDKEARHD